MKFFSSSKCDPTYKFANELAHRIVVSFSLSVKIYFTIQWLDSIREASIANHTNVSQKSKFSLWWLVCDLRLMLGMDCRLIVCTSLLLLLSSPSSSQYVATAPRALGASWPQTLWPKHNRADGKRTAPDTLHTHYTLTRADCARIYCLSLERATGHILFILIKCGHVLGSVLLFGFGRSATRVNTVWSLFASVTRAALSINDLAKFLSYTSRRSWSRQIGNRIVRRSLWLRIRIENRRTCARNYK